MTEPLPCPFCGHVGLSHSEGSTFRWLVTECNGCGAQCEEERIDTLSTDRGAAIEQAKVEAIKTWNTRAALEQQQAEPPEWPLIKNILAVFGLDAIAFVAKWQAAQQQAEPVLLECVTCGTVYADGVPPQVPVQERITRIAWVGLTPEEILDLFDINNVYGSKWIAFARTVEAKLRSKNDY